MVKMENSELMQQIFIRNDERERLFYPCLVISFCMSVLLVFVWVESSNEYNGFDWYRALVLLVHCLTEFPWDPGCLHIIAVGLCSLHTPEQHSYDGYSFMAFGFLLDPFGRRSSDLIIMLIFGYSCVFKSLREHKDVKEIQTLQVAIGLPFFLILLCLYLLPLGNFSACVQEKNKLAPKPYFFGHRGAPMLGPENTIMSFEKAVEHGAYGLESDVHIRPCDGMFWCCTGTGAGVHLLIKPFFGMKPLSEADRERAGNQKIPKLTELLELAQKEKKFVIFDLYGPAPNHSLRALYVHHVVSTILDSQIEQRLIFWLPGFEREYVKKKAPGFQQVSRLHSVERLTKENITRINVDYKNLFYNGMREYRAANISINLYLVNEPWLFSLAWCSRIPSVTTDNIQVLNEMTQPSYFMTPKYYLFVWILMDILSAIFIVAIFYFHWWKESKKEKLLKSTSIHTESLSTSLRTRESKNQGPSCISIDPVSRVTEIPWTHAALSPALTKNVRKYPDSNRVSVVPMKKASKSEPVSKTIKTPVPGEDDIRHLVPTLKASESIQAPVRESAREATFQSSSAMKANGTFSSIDVSHPQKQTERPPNTKSSEESLPVFTTSSPSSSS
ncbi:hypothetical protein E5288_WYG019763 [Bos mutus]|uniref:GP-PDE domain-containing protein n=1 Tax=Bos mutus TaxID=72004 RepID=A0A6B0RQH2_9CETA|nr:hypothetical protein [Bos mutus]